MKIVKKSFLINFIFNYSKKNYQTTSLYRRILLRSCIQVTCFLGLDLGNLWINFHRCRVEHCLLFLLDLFLTLLNCVCQDLEVYVDGRVQFCHPPNQDVDISNNYYSNKYVNEDLDQTTRLWIIVEIIPSVIVVKN